MSLFPELDSYPESVKHAYGDFIRAAWHYMNTDGEEGLKAVVDMKLAGEAFDVACRAEGVTTNEVAAAATRYRIEGAR